MGDRRADSRRLEGLAGPAADDRDFAGEGRDVRALATASIAGAPAHLFNVYVHLKWDGVDYMLLQGWSLDGSRVVRETVK
jgi:hypothetical protein